MTCDVSPSNSIILAMGDVEKFTFTTVPSKASRHIGGLYGAFLACLEKNKQSLQLVGNACDWVLFRVLKLPAEVGNNCRCF